MTGMSAVSPMPKARSSNGSPGTSASHAVMAAARIHGKAWARRRSGPRECRGSGPLAAAVTARPRIGGPKPPPTSSRRIDTRARSKRGIRAERAITLHANRALSSRVSTPAATRFGSRVSAGSPASTRKTAASGHDWINGPAGARLPCNASPSPCSAADAATKNPKTRVTTTRALLVFVSP